jgi:hypothetical protein
MCNTGSIFPNLINVVFSGNNAGNWGGGIYNQSGNGQTLTNVTFSGNNATIGGGIFYNGVRTPQNLKNCIFWGNSSGIYYTESDMIIANSILQENCPDGATCIGVMKADPLFVSQPDFNAAPTVSGDLRLQPCSPAIDAGSDAANTTTSDLDGIPRKFDAFTGGSLIDMGAFEYQSAISSGTRWYVNASAAGGNGTSWACAFNDLQQALAASDAGDEIWVAKGTYKPTTGTDRTASFAMKNGVAIYGGFNGTETAQNQRNRATNVTILSGDIGTPNDNSDNSYHVF